tara:strand:+ start:1723 stop:5205 length:3483 start_codon:yes stop_codon:yes gene_type:complete
MATDHNFRIKNGLEVGGQLIVNSSGALQVSPSTVSSNITLNDNVKLLFGTGADSELYFDGNSTILRNTAASTGYPIYIQGGGGTGAPIYLQAISGTNGIRVETSGKVALYYGANERLQTTSTGIDVTGRIDLNDSNTQLSEGSSNSLRVQTPSGYIDVGPHNTSYAHMGTDRPQFYFNKKIVIGEDILTSYDADLQLQRVNSTKITLTSTGANVTGDLAVSGDLNITGDINSVSVTDLDVVDKTITVGQGQSASNSTGSGLIVSGANANILWHNTNDRWEFNKDIYTSGNIDLGNARIYASGDSNSIHIDVPYAIIGPSTTTTNNPLLGTSAYRWNGVYSSTGSFTGLLSAERLQITTANATINSAHPSMRRGSAGEMFLDAPGDIIMHIDSNNNNTDRRFRVRKDTAGSADLFSVDESAAVVAGAITAGTFVSATDYIRITATGGSKRLLMGNQDSAGVNKPAMIVGVNGRLLFGHGDSWSTNGGTFTEHMNLEGGHLAITSGALKLGTTTVIDSSRNLTNIGTISSGAISASTVGVTNIVTNKVVKFNGAILDDSNITDTGSLITLGSNTTVSGTISSGAITSSGLLNLGGTGSLGSITTNQKILANFDGGYSTNNSAQNKVIGFIGTTVSSLDIFNSTYGTGELLKNFYLGLSTGNSYFNNAKFVIVQGGVERFNMAQGGNSTFSGTLTVGGKVSGQYYQVAGTTVIDSSRNITLNEDLNFSTNGFADISNTGTGAIRFKPSSQTLALTLAGANATFAGTISSPTIHNTGVIYLGSTSTSSDQFAVNNGTDIFIGTTAKGLRTYKDLYTNSGNNKYWHAGNDSSGSGLDADLLDGQHGSYYYSSANPPPTYSKYLRSDTSDSVTAGTTYTFPASDSPAIISTRGGGGASLYVGGWSSGTNSNNIHRISSSSNLHIDSAANGNLYLNYYRGGTTYIGGSNVAWHAGNDGSGSGLDADLLDGQHGSYYATASSLGSYLPKAGGTMSGNIAMANYNITGVNQLEFNDPGEGIVFKSGSSGDMVLKIIDDSSDNILQYSGTNAIFNVQGSITATTKSFDIEHPTKDGMRLHHGVLEGPEHAVYIRGKTKGSLIQLPEYWTGLVHEDTITVQLTPIGKSSELYVKDISDNKVLVSNDTEYFYFIQAERKDIERFEVEYGNSL